MKYSINRVTTHFTERCEERNLSVSKIRLSIILNGNLKSTNDLTNKQVAVWIEEDQAYIVCTHEGRGRFNVVSIFPMYPGNTPEKQAVKQGAYLIKI